MEITRGFECGYSDARIGHGNYKLIKAEAIGKYFVASESLLNCDPDFSNSTKYKSQDVFYNVPRFVTKFCASEICFALDNVGYCNTNSVYNCQLTNQGKDNLYYLLAILNSKTTTFWFNTAFMNIDSLFPHIQKNQLEAIPIPIVSSAFMDRLVSIAREIYNSQSLRVERLSEIDHIVYHLYDLTYDEVLIIDPETPITREQYEAFEC